MKRAAPAATERAMRLTSVVLALMLACGAASATEKADLSKANAALGDENEILLPANYRSWVAIAPSTPGMPTHPQNHLVSRIYVEPSAYEGFVKKGAWPDRTVIVLELRDKTARGANRAVVGLEVAAKNEAHLVEPWTYYGIIFDQHKPAESKSMCPDAAPSEADMRLAMFFPALRAVINARPQAMQPSAF